MAGKKKPIKKRTAKRTASKRKAIKKRPVKKVPARKVSAAKKPKVIGIVTHYFPKVRAAVVKLKAPLSVGDTVKFKGHTTDFTQTVTSMQIDHVPVKQAKKGAEIGLLVESRVRQHDTACKE